MQIDSEQVLSDVTDVAVFLLAAEKAELLMKHGGIYVKDAIAAYCRIIEVDPKALREIMREH